MSLTWEYITIKDKKTKMQVDTGADSTLLSSFSLIEVCKRRLPGKNQSSSLCTARQEIWATWERHTAPRQHQHSVRQETRCSQKIQSACQIQSGIKANFLQSQKGTSTFSRQGQREICDNDMTGIPESVQPGGVLSALSVEWKHGSKCSH